MGRIVWIVFLVLLAIPAFGLSMIWLGILMAPRKSAERMGWSVPKAIGMATLFTVLWFTVYAVGYAVALTFGWVL